MASLTDRPVQVELNVDGSKQIGQFITYNSWWHWCIESYNCM